LAATLVLHGILNATPMGMGVGTSSSRSLSDGAVAEIHAFWSFVLMRKRRRNTLWQHTH